MLQWDQVVLVRSNRVAPVSEHHQIGDEQRHEDQSGNGVQPSKLLDTGVLATAILKNI